jgi:ABC-2 type transport system permease protein
MVALASVPGILAWISMSGGGGRNLALRQVEIYHGVNGTVTAATLSIAVLVLGAATLRDERDGGTLPYLFLSPVGRIPFAVSAWMAAVGAAVLVAASGWAVGAIGLVVTTGDIGPALPALAAYAAAAVGYAALFLPLGYLFSRSILVGIAYVFVWEGILAAFMPGLGASSVWRTALSIYGDLTPLPPEALDVLGGVAPGVGGGLLKLAAMVVLGIGALVWALRARDAV